MPIMVYIYRLYVNDAAKFHERQYSDYAVYDKRIDSYGNCWGMEISDWR
jgi:hypothetical protein